VITNKGEVLCEEWLDGDGWKHDYYSPLVTNGVLSYEELGDGFLDSLIRREFTGLYDSNKNPIYEGDILTNNFNCKGPVFYENGRFKCIMKYKDDGECITFDLIKVAEITNIIGILIEEKEIITNPIKSNKQ
jgi:hypothetical protein